jgi:glycosyltransferase involved in cell wall biosynthesis/GNAT superfamily N-acetyltransferase
MSLYNYEINRATLDDIKTHLQKVSDLFSPPLDSYVNISNYACKIKNAAITIEAWSQNELIGLIACYLNNKETDEGYITNVSVLKEHQGKGITSKLLELTIDQAQKNEYNKILLEVGEDNKTAIALYKKYGFYLAEKRGTKHSMVNRLNDKKDIMVSVCCVTYNHKYFIAHAIDGFLMQKTDFPFEVLIHDDASTDGTATIIREYEAKYPDIIKPIYQTENQYSKGVKISLTYQWIRAKGKYIAMCEGDDYWIDPYKLQKQVDFLETHEDVSMCFHNVKLINAEGKEIGNCRRYKKDQYAPIGDLILGGGLFCPTASLVFRTQYIKFGYPDFCMNCHVGDYPLQLYLSLKGKVYYFDNEMSVYRRGIPNSWSQTFEKIAFSLRAKKWMSEFKMLDGINALSNYKYSSVITKRQGEYLIGIILANRNKKTEIKKIFGNYISKFQINDKIKIFLIYHAFFFYRVFAKLSSYLPLKKNCNVTCEK